MAPESNYSKFSRCLKELWRAEHGSRMEPSYFRYCVDYVSEYVTRADLAWTGNETEGPRSISGSDHLMVHIAHDWELSERQEVAFRNWWLKVMNYGFGQAKDAA